jgi:hypothetical protein
VASGPRVAKPSHATARRAALGAVAASGTIAGEEDAVPCTGLRTAQARLDLRPLWCGLACAGGPSQGRARRGDAHWCASLTRVKRCCPARIRPARCSPGRDMTTSARVTGPPAPGHRVGVDFRMPRPSQGKDCTSAFPAGCSRNTLDHAPHAAKEGEQPAPRCHVPAVQS